MTNTNDDIVFITEVINMYFRGTYQGDANELKKAFHPHARITGIINNDVHDWSVTEFITRVTTPPSAVNKGEKYDKQIILIDKTSNTAIVKARVLVGELIFIDYITLLKIEGQWVIRNKSFSN